MVAKTVGELVDALGEFDRDTEIYVYVRHESDAANYGISDYEESGGYVDSIELKEEKRWGSSGTYTESVVEICLESIYND